jgi:L-cysteine desulfidase
MVGQGAFENLMNLLKEILAHEVFPAVGCTEPISCAYAAAIASSHLGSPVESLSLTVDRGTYKNGAAVVVPHSGGERGNLVAAALGAVLRNPESELELLAAVTPETREQARRLLGSGRCASDCLEESRDLYVRVELEGGGHRALCVLSGSHTHVERVEKDGEVVEQATGTGEKRGQLSYREILRNLSLDALLMKSCRPDADDLEYLRRGVQMNREIGELGSDTKRTAFQLRQMRRKEILADDLFYRTKVRVASAVDARMAGLPYPAMTSGGSGNQGIVAILTPHEVGRELGVDEETILRSIAVAHGLNAYVKCFVGELSVICGCAMAAGIAAAVAIVYQQAGVDIEKITFAINNVVGDLGGLICDGAKPGCSMKTVTSVDAAMRSAFMALEGYGLSDHDGVIGRDAEESIRNLGRLTLEGMLEVDPTVIDILQMKIGPSGRA